MRIRLRIFLSFGSEERRGLGIFLSKRMKESKEENEPGREQIRRRLPSDQQKRQI